MKQGRERPKAWMYSVINPVLEGIRLEASFLLRGNWTFRRYNRDLEYIRPLDAYLDYQSRPNWEDFRASNPEVVKPVEDREARREGLRKACEAAFESLASNTDFRQTVADCMVAFETENLGARDSVFHQNVPLHEGVAEIVVNNIKQLPVHFGPHRFWSRFRDELMEFRRGPYFLEADRAGAEFKHSNEQVSAVLTGVRSTLAAEYDIPWAPYYDESISLPGR